MSRQVLRSIFLSAPARRVAGAVYRYLRRSDFRNEEDAVRARYDIHPTARWAEGTMIFGEGEIAIGARTYLGHGCHVSSHPAGARIVIGRQCALAHNIHIRTTNYARVPDFREAFDMPPESADIVIGDYVWIGSHVYICAGVTVGDNSVIGANSVVARDVPPNTVVGGVPARVIHDKSVYTAPRPALPPTR